MPLEDFGVSFTQDSRAVSAVIGFLLVFSFIIILLSINQAQFVPQENSEIEFQHYQEVQDDMVEVRSAISTAGQANVSQYPTVELGTSYPTRLFALNPPAPAGTLETTDRYDITLQNASNSATVETQFLVYRPGYNELDENPIWYENSVLYVDARDNSGGIAVLEDQNLIRGGSQVRISAVQNDFSVTSAGRVTIEIYPTDNTDVNLDEWTGDVTVEIPTRLTGAEYWDDELGGTGVYNGVTEDGVESGIHLLSLTVDANSLKFNTVGINEAPDGQGSARRGIGVGGTTGGGGDGGDGGDGGSDPTLTYVDTFYDGDGNSEPNEDSTIPPDNPIGDINNFNKMTTGDDNQYGQISEGGNNDYTMELGLSAGGIPSRTSHTVQVQYYMDKGEQLTLEVVYENGTEVDGSTTYNLPRKNNQNNEGTENITLSNNEVTYINNNGRIYIVLTDSRTDNQNTRVYTDFVRVRSN